MQSNKFEQTAFCCSDNYMNSLLSVSEDPMREILEIQMKALRTDNDSKKSDIPVGASRTAANMGTDAQFDLPELKQDCTSSTEMEVLPCFYPYESTGNTRHDTSVSDHWLPREETVSLEPYMNMDWQHAESYAIPLDAVKVEGVDEFNYNLEGEAETSDVVSKNMYGKRRQRPRTAQFEHKRRSLIAERMQALAELLPSSSKVKRSDQECILDNTITHVKYLQLQLKELSRTKLGGQSFSAPLNFVEGYGHYHPHEQMLEEPLEEVVGSLLEENQLTIFRLLEHKGLYMMPLTSLDGLMSAEVSGG